MAAIDSQRLAMLDGIHLARGQHVRPSEGMCVVEAAAWLAGEPHSDHPDCVDPVLGAFCRRWNDLLDQEARDRLLKPIVPRIIGTKSSPSIQAARAFMATDWAVRTYTPAWLRVAGLDHHAAILEQLPAISSTATPSRATRAIQEAAAAGAAAGAAARDAAWAAARAAARAAAGDAAWDAAWAAAGDAVWAAAGAAAWDAAWAAAGAAARAAARDAAGAAAGAAAWDAAWAAARDAAWAAARAAARAAAGDAARAAAWDALAPTVATLQASALELLGRMIEAH